MRPKPVFREGFGAGLVLILGFGEDLVVELGCWEKPWLDLELGPLLGLEVGPWMSPQAGL